MTIAAFFDLDGTLLPAPSIERRYLRYLRWRGDLRTLGWLRTAARMIPLALRANWSWETRDAGEAEFAVLAANNKAYLRGVPCWTMRSFCAWLERYPLPLLCDARRRIAWHAEQGHAIVIVTGAPAPLANAVAQELHAGAEVLATQLESANDRWTGRVGGPAMAGITKARAIAQLAHQRHWHLQECFAYGDSWADRWMLQRVGHAIAVNPDGKLERLARENRWPVARWSRQPASASASDAAARFHNEGQFIAKLREAAQRRGYRITALSPQPGDATNHPTEITEEHNGLHTHLEPCDTKPVLG